MIRPSKIERNISSILNKVPESTHIDKRSTTPLNSRSAFVKKKIVIGRIQTIGNKNKKKPQSRIQEPSISRITNQNDGSINLLVNNSCSRIFNQVNKSLSKISFEESFFKATREVPMEKSVLCSNPQILDNSVLRETRREEKEREVEEELALTRAGNGCKLVSSLEFDQFEEMEKSYHQSKGKVIESMGESMLLESMSYQ